MLSKHSSFNKLADNLISGKESYNRLKEIANKHNYPHKIKTLHTKLSEEVAFWSRKNPTPQLVDCQKDLTFIESQLKTEHINKEKVDLLTKKYL